MEKENKYSKNRFSSSKRMLEVGTKYSITINAEDQHTNFEDRLSRQYRYYKKRLSKLHFEYKLWLEISTPLDGRPPRIHLHGIIWFRNHKQILRWYEKDSAELSRSMNINIDTIPPTDEGMIEWLNYCQKDSILMNILTDGKYIIESVGYTMQKDA